MILAPLGTLKTTTDLFIYFQLPMLQGKNFQLVPYHPKEQTKTPPSSPWELPKRSTINTAGPSKQPSLSSKYSDGQVKTIWKLTNFSQGQSPQICYDQSSSNPYPEINSQKNDSWDSWLGKKLKKIIQEELNPSQNKSRKDTKRFGEERTNSNYEQPGHELR